MVGAARRLATELVVIIARATQEIHWVVPARVRAAGTAAEPPTGTSAALMASLEGELLRSSDSSARPWWVVLRSECGAAARPGTSPDRGDVAGPVYSTIRSSRSVLLS